MANYCVYSGAGTPGTGTVAGSVPTAGEWDTAYASITLCLAGITEADGDIIFVAHDHNHNEGAAISWNFSHTSGLVRVISIDRTNTTTATPLAGATETTGGNTGFTILNGFSTYFFGLVVTAGAGASSASATITVGTGTVDAAYVFDKCEFYSNTTNTSANFTINGANATAVQFVNRLINCTVRKAAAALIGINCSGVKQLDLTGLILAGTAPVTVLSLTGPFSVIKCSGSDLSGATNLAAIGTDDAAMFVSVNNCKLPTNVTTGTHFGTGSHVIECVACSTGDNAYEYYYQDGHGIITHDTGIYLTSGGLTLKDTDGTSTNVSQKFVPNSTYVSKAFPLCGPWSYEYVSSTGSKTVSAKIAYDQASALKDCECWLEVEYMGGGAAVNCPQFELATTAPIVSGTLSRDILAAGSNLSDTSEAWTGTGGWTNKKTATLSKTVTVDEIGFLRARLCVGANTTVYFDPVLTVA